MNGNERHNRPTRRGSGQRVHNADDQNRVYAAVDLGTNNCRLLIARPKPGGFRVIDAFSRTVRLGEGLEKSGQLSERAMQRTIDALKVCAAKMRRRKVTDFRAIATEACRMARNRHDFLERVERQTGIKLDIIPSEEEASLAASGCAPLVDPASRIALVFDIGGGSTELIWLDASGAQRVGRALPILAWTSLPFGVVTLAERFPEALEAASGPLDGESRDVDPSARRYREMVAYVLETMRRFEGAQHLKTYFDKGEAHLIGNSGTVTTLAGVQFGLPKYDRAQIDGAWLDIGDLLELTDRLQVLGPAGRSLHPCIGADRSDLLIPGCAILEGIYTEWPARRLRVADRGLREGMLIELMNRTPKAVSMKHRPQDGARMPGLD